MRAKNSHAWAPLRLCFLINKDRWQHKGGSEDWETVQGNHSDGHMDQDHRIWLV